MTHGVKILVLLKTFDGCFLTHQRILPDCSFKSNQRTAEFFYFDSTVSCTPRSFFKIRIPRRNQIQKYFNLFSSDQMDSNQENRGKKISYSILERKWQSRKATAFLLHSNQMIRYKHLKRQTSVQVYYCDLETRIRYIRISDCSRKIAVQCLQKFRTYVL